MRISFSLLLIAILWQPAASQGYYPLEIGNLWEYWDRYEPYYGWTTRAARDTVMPNQISYRFLQHDNGFHEFFRQSDSRVYEYSTARQREELLYDFSKTTGDTVSVIYAQNETTIVTVLSDGYQNVFGETRRQWRFFLRVLPTSFYIIRQVTDSIGLTDRQVEPGEAFSLRGAIINGIKYGTVSAIDDNDLPFSSGFELFQNFPNPFNPSTTITYYLSRRSRVRLEIWDIVGRKVATLTDQLQEAGKHSVNWNPHAASSGVYYYRLNTENQSITRKMAVTR